MEDKINIIEKMRSLSEAFISNNIDFNSFFNQMGAYLGEWFDPLDSELEGLNDKLKEEVTFYSKYTGGEFKTISRIPEWKGNDNSGRIIRI